MPWRNVFVADCNGGMHLMANTPIEMNFNWQTPKLVMDNAMLIVKEAARKACPALDHHDFVNFIIPSFQFGLKFVESEEKRKKLESAFLAKCPNLAGGGFEKLVGMDDHDKKDHNDVRDVFRKVLPASCTYDQYATGNGCGAGLKLPLLGIELQLIAHKCGDNHLLPYGRLQCRGPGCEDLLKPCNTDADCGGASNDQVKCFDMIEQGKDLTSENMFEAFAKSDILLDKNDNYTSTFCSKVYPKEGMLGE
jgi:hypothetical protein